MILLYIATDNYSIVKCCNRVRECLLSNYLLINIENTKLINYTTVLLHVYISLISQLIW